MRNQTVYKLTAPSLSSREIMLKAEELFKRYVWKVGPGKVIRNGLRFNDVYTNLIYPEYGIKLIDDRKLGMDEEGHKVLGLFDAEINTAYIDSSLHIGTENPRYAFTLWHEVAGHGIIHGDCVRQQLQQIENKAQLITTDYSILSEDVFEKQANCFAANASAPIGLVDAVIAEVFGLSSHRQIRYIGPREYTLDINGTCRKYEFTSYQDFCRFVAKKIKYFFGGLSIESLSYRVQKCSRVVDCSDDIITPMSRRTYLQRTEKRKSGDYCNSDLLIANAN